MTDRIGRQPDNRQPDNGPETAPGKAAAQGALQTTVTYLQMTERPRHGTIPHPGDKVAILRAENPPIHFYRYLYDRIGRAYCWVIRRCCTDAELKDMLHHPDTELYVLYVRGVPMGMAELEFKDRPAARLAYLGLMAEAQGRGLGSYLLSQAVQIAWSRPIEKLLLNTCTLDHPRALPMYQRMGFSVYAREEQTLPIPPDWDGPTPEGADRGTP